MEELFYSYERIDLEQFAFFEDNLSGKLGNMQLNSQIQFSFDKGKNLICCRMGILMHDKDTPLLKATMCSYFGIREDSVEKMRKGGQIEFPVRLLVQFASLNYGSMRGALYLKMQGTPLARYILPPVFLDKVIDKPFVAPE